MISERIEYQGKTWALIIRGGKVDSGVHFFTPDNNPLQLGKQWRLKGTKIAPHTHCSVTVNAQNNFMQEVLYVERGKLKIIFYTDNGNRMEDRILNAGDTILLIQGGHGFEILEDTQMLEVKMGPYDPASKKNIEVEK